MKRSGEPAHCRNLATCRLPWSDPPVRDGLTGSSERVTAGHAETEHRADLTSNAYPPFLAARATFPRWGEGGSLAGQRPGEMEVWAEAYGAAYNPAGNAAHTVMVSMT